MKRIGRFILIVFFVALFVGPVVWFLSNGHLQEIKDVTSQKKQEDDNVDIDSLGGVTYKLENGVLTITPTNGKDGLLDATKIKGSKSTAMWFKDVNEISKIRVQEGYRVFLNPDSTGLFYGLTYVKEIDLSGFDARFCENASRMFEGCENLTSLDLNGWDLSKLSVTTDMFLGCKNLTEFKANDSKVTSAYNAK